MKKVQPTLAHFKFQKFVKSSKGNNFEVKMPTIAKEKDVICNKCNNKFTSLKYLNQHMERSKSCLSSLHTDSDTQMFEESVPDRVREISEKKKEESTIELSLLKANPKPRARIRPKLAKSKSKDSSRSKSTTGKTKQQSHKRKSYTVNFKVKVIQDLNQLADCSKKKLETIANLHHISKGLVSKWKKDEKRIVAAWHESRSKTLGGRRQSGSKSTRSRRKIRKIAKSKFYEAEERTKEELLSARKKGLKVSERWIRTRMRKYIRQYYGDEQAESFKASKNWMCSFQKRQNVSLRRRTNKKKVGTSENLTVIQKFHQQLRKDLNSCRRRTKFVQDVKWGRWLPERRYNVDQVPLPFVVDQEVTYEITGSKAVWITQPASGLDKRQCTLQLCIRPTEPQNIPPAIIFRGKGNVKASEIKMYDKRVHVYWQKNGWMDSTVADKWVQNTFASSVDKSRENVLFVDNLSCQCTKDFHDICRKKANTVVYPFPPSVTDKIQPIDAGEGYMMKKLIGCQLDSYLEDDRNFDQWCGQGYSASERRVMLTKWVGEAWTEMAKYLNFRRRLFEKTGTLMTVTKGEEDKLINPQGYDDYTF